MKRALAALLCATVAFSSGSFSQIALAAENLPITDVADSSEGISPDAGMADDSAAGEEKFIEQKSSSSEKGADSENSSSKKDFTSYKTYEDSSYDPSKIAGNSEQDRDGETNDASEEQAEDGSEKESGEGTGAESADLTEAENETEAELASLEDSADGALVADTADAAKSGTSDLPEGINAMPDGYKLSSDDLEMKKNALSKDVLDTMEGLSEGDNYAFDEVICLADSKEEAERTAYAYSGELMEYAYGVATISLKDSPLSVKEAYEYALDKDLELPYVEPNYITEIDDPDYSEESGELFSTGSDVPAGNGFTDYWGDGEGKDPYLSPSSDMFQWHHTMINTYAAWGVTTGSKDITVAVIDSGTWPDHEDLKDNISEDAIDVASYGPIKDEDGHGTHVAGIIAAELNGILGAGVAPGVTILPVKTQEDGEKELDDDAIVRGINYVAGVGKDGSKTGRRADIANMSIGSPVYSAAQEEAINAAYEAGVTLVAAMGNEKANNLSYPAALDHVIGVASVNKAGLRADYSTFGSWADISAPGCDMYSASVKDTRGYVPADGTSMAAPVIAGACALYMSAVGHVDPDTMEEVLLRSVWGDAGEGTGAGIIDLAKMFDGDTRAPKITLTCDNGDKKETVENGETCTVSGKVSENATISFAAQNFGGAENANNNTKIVYTLDGSTPTVYDGNITNENAKVYDNKPLKVSDIAEGEAGENTFTVKAIAVTGMGVVSALSTLEFTVDTDSESEKIETGYSVEIRNNPARLVAGRSLKLEAEVLSETAGNVSQKVTWSIDGYTDGDLSGAKINASNGNLTTAPDQTGKLTVRCESNATAAYATAEITVTQDIYPISTMTIGDVAPISFGKDGKTSGPLYAYLTTLTDTREKDNDLLKNNGYKDYDFIWTSSNPDVLLVRSVDEKVSDEKKAPTIELIPVGVGTSTLTCKALDGSSKTAKTTVTVTSAMKADSISITEDGKELTAKTIYAGDALTLTAVQKYSDSDSTGTVYPAWKSSNTKVVSLSVDEQDENKVTIKAESKGTATITCTATDGSNKKASIKVTVKQPVTDIDVVGQWYIAQGASAKYTAKLLPANADNKKYEIGIRGYGGKPLPEGITVRNGTVSVAASVPEDSMFEVYAKSADTGKEAGQLVAVMGKATKVEAEVADGQLATIAANTAANTTVIEATASNGTLLSFKTSNPKVATVSKTDGNKATITAVGKGTCFITATAQDGSKKSAKVKITVVNMVKSIEVTGQSSIAKGSRAKFKAAVEPSNASNKKVEWELDGTYTGVSINQSTGQVTVSADAKPGQEVKVKATALDGSKVSKTISFYTTGAKIKGLSIVADPGSVIEKVHNIATDKSGAIKALRLYDVDIPAKVGVTNVKENQIVLTTAVSNAEAVADGMVVSWKSSDEKVAEVSINEDGSATVIGNAPGTATLTCTAMDGSGKKASVKVTVITPAAGLVLTPSSNTKTTVSIDGLYNYAVSPDGSVTTSVTLSDTYGRVSVSEVEWEYDYGYVEDGVFIFKSYSEAQQNLIKKNKMFFTLSAGDIKAKSYDKLEADKKKLYGDDTEADLEKIWPSVKIRCKTTDGTDYYHDLAYTVPYNHEYRGTTEILVDNDVDEPNTSFCLELDEKTTSTTLYISNDSVICNSYLVESSDPDILTAYAGSQEEYEDYHKDNPDKYKMLLHLYANTKTNKKGKVQLTITALDGSNVYTTIEVEVK